MFCPNCGKENPDGASFCAGCGMALGTPVAAQPAPQPAAPVAQPVAAPVAAAPVAAAPVAAAAPQQPAAQQTIIPPQQPQAQAQPQPQAQPKESSMLPFGMHFKNLFNAAIHPVTGPAEIVPKYDKIGNSLILAAIVIVICSIVSFISDASYDMIKWNTVGRYLYSGVGLRLARDFFFPYLYYAIRVFGCAGIFTLAGLIIKEKWSFSRLLAISALATAPAYVISDFFGTFVGLIPVVRFGTIFTTAAYLYYILMLFEGVTSETKLTGNKKGFVLVICIALTGFAAQYLA